MSSHAIQTADRIISLPEPHPRVAHKHPQVAHTPREAGDTVDGRNLLRGTQERKYRNLTSMRPLWKLVTMS